MEYINLIYPKDRAPPAAAVKVPLLDMEYINLIYPKDRDPPAAAVKEPPPRDAYDVRVPVAAVE